MDARCHAGRLLWTWFVALGAALLLAPIPAGAADAYEPDNTSATARRFIVNDLAQFHTFEPVGDQDWVYFFAEPDRPYTVDVTTVSATCDPHLTVFYGDARTTVPNGEQDRKPAGASERYSTLGLPMGFYYVRLRSADGASGPGVNYWLRVYQTTGAGTPIETVDENRVNIGPSGGAPGRAQMAVLIPGQSGIYKQHRIEFPGYDEVPSGTGIEVKIRQIRDETEKYGRPGQVFPPLSQALFVVETAQWTGGTTHSIAFSDPVNLTIQFAAYGAPSEGWNDIVTFRNEISTIDQMRAVRDVMDGQNIDFQGIGAPQVLDVAQRKITISNYPNLTGASGQATYGAVAGAQGETDVRRWTLYP